MGPGELPGGVDDAGAIEELYLEASRGQRTADDFWLAVGLTPDCEDEYLERHTLTPGLMAFLEQPAARASRIWCLSNDLSRWSEKLRKRFGLEAVISDWIVSGDVGSRKPDRAIYDVVLRKLAQLVPSADALFIDDREKNVRAAEMAGLRSVLFAPGPPALR